LVTIGAVCNGATTRRRRPWRSAARQGQPHYDTGIYPYVAAASAKEADVAIAFVYQPSGEGDDGPSIALPFG
jgi:beta-glucosidase